MRVEINKDDIKEKKADSRGRITLGKEYANHEVEIAVLSENDKLRKKEDLQSKVKKLLEIADKTGIDLENDLKKT